MFVLPPQFELSVCFGSDASGRWWCGARWDTQWFQLGGPNQPDSPYYLLGVGTSIDGLCSVGTHVARSNSVVLV